MTAKQVRIAQSPLQSYGVGTDDGLLADGRVVEAILRNGIIDVLVAVAGEVGEEIFGIFRGEVGAAKIGERDVIDEEFAVLVVPAANESERQREYSGLSGLDGDFLLRPIDGLCECGSIAVEFVEA